MVKKNLMEVKPRMEWDKLFKEIGGLLRFIQQAGEQGIEINRRGTLDGTSLQSKSPAIYDFHLSMGSLSTSHKKGKSRTNGGRLLYEGIATSNRAVEPVIDIFEEPGWLTVVAQLPGVAASDVKLDIEGSTLVLQVGEGERKYIRKVPLPFAADLKKCLVSFINGVLEIRIPDQNKADQGSEKGENL